MTSCPVGFDRGHTVASTAVMNSTGETSGRAQGSRGRPALLGEKNRTDNNDVGHVLIELKSEKKTKLEFRSIEIIWSGSNLICASILKLDKLFG